MLCIILTTAIMAAIMVMPASATTVTFSPTDKDSQLNEFAPDVPGDTSHIDFTVQSWATNKDIRAVIHFDLSSLPSDVTIDSATLYLYQWKVVPDEARTNNVHRITASWVEGVVTWNSRDGTTDWGTPGGDYEPTVTASASTGATDGMWVQWDIKTDVQGFVSGTYTNYGWLIKDASEESASRKKAVYWSREYPDDTTKRPKLEVTYTPAATPTPGPGPTGVPEFSPMGLIALIGVLSVLLAGTTVCRGKRRQ